MNAHSQNSVLSPARVTIVFLVIALGAFVYRNSLSGPFLTDDYYTIVRNFPLRDLSNTREIVSQNLFASAGKATSAWRCTISITATMTGRETSFWSR